MPGQLRPDLFVFGAQLFDLGTKFDNSLFLALRGWQRQYIGQKTELCAKLFLQILLGARETGESGVLRHRACAGRGQCLLDRASANGLGQPKTFRG